MLVNDNNKIVWGIINDPVNEFSGTVDNLWNNPANWSLGVLPNANTIAIISADCLLNANVVIRTLVVSDGCVLTKSNNINSKNYILNGIFIDASVSNISVTDGKESIWSGFTRTGASTITLSGSDMPIPPIDYFRLNVNGVSGSSYLQADLLTADNFNLVAITGTIDCKNYNIVAQGNIQLNGGGQSLLLLDNNIVEAFGNMTFAGGTIGVTNVNSTTIFKPHGTLQTNGTLNFNDAKLMFQEVESSWNITSGTTTANNIYVSGVLLVNNVGALNIINLFFDLGSELKFTNTGVINFNNTNWDDFLGELVLNEAETVFNYGLTDDQLIKVPKDGEYKELRLQGSGNKILLGNITCTFLFLTGSAEIDYNGFTITGFTKYRDTRSINSNLPSISTLELLQISGVRTLTSDLTVTDIEFTVAALTLNKNGHTLTGVNVYTRINTTAATPPSQLDGHTNWFYDSTGAQSVIGGAYENLILGGSGVKTLRGNVTYTGTYTITGTATVNLNGFTITKI